jgi:hypothetical protein
MYSNTLRKQIYLHLVAVPSQTYAGPMVHLALRVLQADWLAATVAMAAGTAFERQAGWFSGPSRRGWVWGETQPAGLVLRNQRCRLVLGGELACIAGSQDLAIGAGSPVRPSLRGWVLRPSRAGWVLRTSQQGLVPICWFLPENWPLLAAWVSSGV